MPKFQIFPDGRAAGSAPVSGSDFVTRDYLTGSIASGTAGSIVSASYSSVDKKIYLYNAGNTASAEIDATDFIKDGMLDDAEVSESYLVLTFNTDAGKEPLSMSLTDIFNPNNYYSKTDVNTLLTTMSVGDVNVIEAIEFNGTASTITNKTASITFELPSGSDVAIFPVDNSQYDAETGTWSLGTEFVSEVSAALADSKAIYLAVTTIDGTIYPAFTLNMGSLYGFGGITMPGDPSVVHTWQLQTGTGTLTYITASVQKHIPGLESWFTQYSESLVQTEQWVASSGSVAMSASLWTIQNSASLVASASLAEIAFSSSVAISSKTGSYDTLMGLPAVTAADNGKILRVVSGSWALEMPIAVYNGSAAPSDNLGNNGDIYLQTS